MQKMDCLTAFRKCLAKKSVQLKFWQSFFAIIAFNWSSIDSNLSKMFMQLLLDSFSFNGWKMFCILWVLALTWSNQLNKDLFIEIQLCIFISEVKRFHLHQISNLLEVWLICNDKLSTLLLNDFLMLSNVSCNRLSALNIHQLVFFDFCNCSIKKPLPHYIDE
jgi:hypothetical protein